MSTIDNMKNGLLDFSKNERKIAEHFIKYPYDGQRLSVDAAADLIGVSRSAVIRFCHKMGFNGYSEFRYSLAGQKSIAGNETGNDAPVLKTYSELIQLMQNSMNQDTLDRVADILSRSRRVITIGQLHSALSAEQMAFRLNRIGIDSNLLDDLSIVSAYTRILTAGDAVIVFSISGNSYQDVLNEFKKQRVSTILVTMTANSPSAKFADQVLLLPSAIHMGNRYVLDEAVPFFIAVEMIIEKIYDKNYFSETGKEEQSI